MKAAERRADPSPTRAAPRDSEPRRAPRTGEAPSFVARATVERVLGGIAELRGADGALLRAVPLGTQPLAAGDRVLAALVGDEAFVLGVVGATDAAPQLRVEQEDGRRRTVLHVPAGDITLRAEAGAIELDARDGIRLQAPGATSVSVDPGSVRVVAPSVSATAARADGAFGEARVVTRTLAVTADRVVQAVGLLETRAERIVERAKATYREVEDLAQIRAGRLRSVARTTVQMLGQRAVLRAVKDFKILGDKIHLA